MCQIQYNMQHATTVLSWLMVFLLRGETWLERVDAGATCFLLCLRLPVPAGCRSLGIGMREVIDVAYGSMFTRLWGGEKVEMAP